MKLLLKLIPLIASILIAGEALAGHIPWLSQADFDQFNTEFGGATQYRAVASAEPLGLIGFDVSIEATSATIDGTTVVIPKVKFQKGLFAGFDISGYYSTIPTSGLTGIGNDGTLYGIALSYAIWEGGAAKPALAIRGSYTQAEIPSIVSTTTYGVDTTISKGIGPITPYAGIGLVQMKSTDLVGTGFSASSQQNRYFYGLSFDLLLLNLTLESDTTGGIQTYTVKGGFRF